VPSGVEVDANSSRPSTEKHHTSFTCERPVAEKQVADERALVRVPVRSTGPPSETPIRSRIRSGSVTSGANAVSAAAPLGESLMHRSDLGWTSAVERGRRGGDHREGVFCRNQVRDRNGLGLAPMTVPTIRGLYSLNRPILPHDRAHDGGHSSSWRYCRHSSSVTVPETECRAISRRSSMSNAQTRTPSHALAEASAHRRGS
jgi:hypothetical protein